MSSRWALVLALGCVLGVGTVLCVNDAGGKGGGHGGGHHGGHHGAHHSHHHSHHDTHHHTHHHHHGGYAGGGWGGGYGGWGGGYGGYGAYGGWGGYGGNRWGLPLGGWNNYDSNQPISLPLDPTANNGAQYNNFAGGPEPEMGDDEDGDGDDEDGDDDDSDNKQPGSSQAGDDADDDDEDDDDYRAAIQLVLPDKDAHVFLNGKLVPGVGTKRLLLTPEIDEDEPEKFHVLAVWEENGRPAQREVDLELKAAGGTLLNFTKPDTKPAGEPAPAANQTK